MGRPGKAGRENLAKRWDGYVIYTPVIQKIYAQFTKQNRSEARERGIPNGFSLYHLNYLRPNGSLWYQKYALYSAGQFDKSTIDACMVPDRDRDGSIVIGESAGFQIGTGALAAIKRWRKPTTPEDIFAAWEQSGVRNWIVRSLDLHCD